MTRYSDEPKSPAIAKGTYRHNKTGSLYEVVGVALQVETGEFLVIYKPLYDHPAYEIFARPYAIFTELVELGGKMMPRFERVKHSQTFIA